MKKLEKLTEKIANELDASLCDVFTREEQSALIQDFFTDYNIDFKSIVKMKKNDNDFWNDLNINDSHWCDISSEFADGRVDIYNNDLWESVKDFSEWTEQALDEFGIDGCGIKEGGLTQLFAMGQYMYYSELINSSLHILEEYTLEELNNIN